MEPIQGLRKKIEAAISDPGPDRDLFLKGLTMLSKGYGLLTGMRNLFYDLSIIKEKRLPCPVVGIGNILAGGTGKTPMTIYTARLLSGMGYDVAVLSRGYGGSFEKTGGIVSDGNRILCGFEEAGDEPFMMARSLEKIPVLVGKDRFAMGLSACRRYGVDVLVCDDVYQHRRLHRDINILLLPAGSPFGNGRLLPRGPLREPASQVARADAIVRVRFSTLLSEPANMDEPASAIPVFNAEKVAVLRGWVLAGGKIQDNVAGMTSGLTGLNLFAFSGIAGNSSFVESILVLGGKVAGHIGFSDHHRYTPGDMAGIESMAEANGAEAMVTTEKDFARLPAKYRWGKKLFIVGVEMKFDDEKGFAGFIKERLDSVREKDHAEAS